MMFDFSVATPTDIQHKTQLNQGGKTNQGEAQSGLPAKADKKNNIMSEQMCQTCRIP